MSHLSRPALAVAVVLGAASLVGPGLTGVANAANSCAGSAAPGSNDVNGDGIADLVAGDPGATVGSAAGAGRIVVRYGTNARDFSGAQHALNQHTAKPSLTAQAGDHFGASVAMGLIDSDACTDVVVATPGDTVGTHRHAGSVQVIFGSPGGLGQGRATLSITAGTPGLGSSARAGERFGSSLALTDRVAGQDTQLAIGVPRRNVGSAVDAGAVALIDFSPKGSGTVKAAHTVSQSSPGVDGTSERGDRFGAALDFEANQALIVGAPGENNKAGDIVRVKRTGTAGHYTSKVWSQHTAGVKGVAHAGDGFGSSLDWALESFTGRRFLAVGIPGDDVGAATNAGSVQLFRYSGALDAGDDWLVNQNTAGVAGTAEKGDHFGSTVLMVFAHSTSYRMDLVVGAPDENVGSLVNAGSVTVISADENRPGNVNNAVTQDSPKVPGAAQAGEHFGASLGQGFSDNDALVGVPDDKGNPHGAVLSIPWVTMTGEFPSAGAVWTPSRGSRFGASLSDPS